jgi:hypothetical protein
MELVATSGIDLVVSELLSRFMEISAGTAKDEEWLLPGEGKDNPQAMPPDLSGAQSVAETARQIDRPERRDWR